MNTDRQYGMSKVEVMDSDLSMLWIQVPYKNEA